MSKFLNEAYGKTVTEEMIQAAFHLAGEQVYIYRCSDNAP